MATYTAVNGKNGKTHRAQVMVAGIRRSQNFDKLAEAKAWATDIEGELRAKTQGRVVSKSLRDALPKYEEYYLQDRRAKGLIAEDEEPKEIERIRRFAELPFASRPMADVGKQDIVDWIDARLQDVASATVKRDFNSLKRIFRVSMERWSFLARSPFAGLEPPPDSPARTRRVNDAEQLAMMKALDYTEGMIPETAKQFVGAAIVLAVETAMRKGEILSLDQESRVAERIVHLSMTKNGDERNVKISARALAILDTLPKEGNLIPVHHNTFQKVFDKARKQTGVYWRFHDLRREATTRLAAKMKDVMKLSAQTGHRDLKTLMRVYYKPSLSELNAAAAELD